MKRPSHKQLHRLLLRIFIVLLLVGFGLALLINVQTAAKEASDNPFPVANDRVN
ncbi:MAG TPA: hypothetical protein QF873_03980 [Patescibacteria group bacterium]|nr:hypothetical protein [Patescibacteria group bacterium]